MSKITVRLMKSGDIGRAARIHKEITKEGTGQDAGYSIKNLLVASVSHPGKTCMVAEKDGTVVGFIVGEVREWSFGAERTGWIEIVGVDQNHMGSGIGRMLGRKIIEHFTEKGVESVHTAVAWGSGDLLSFFKSLGFERSEFMNLEKRLKRSKGAAGTRK